MGWRAPLAGEPLTLILLRHGVTASTLDKRFCGTGGSDPGLVAEGEAQAQRAADHLAARGGIDAIIASPLRRTQETAGVVGRALGLEVETEPLLAEAAFGDWDGHTFAEIMERWPAELDAWLASTAVAPPGGETFDAVAERAVQLQRRLVDQHAGRTLLAVSHVTPIKMFARLALGAPIDVIYRMELAPASLTTVVWWPDGTPSLRSFSVSP